MTAYNSKNLPEIDRLTRLQIRDIKPLVKKWKELQAEGKCEGATEESYIGSTGFSYEDIEIEIRFYPLAMKILIKWNYQGKSYKQNIALTERRSNLGNGTSFLMFVCPFSGEECRKLYTDWRIWIGRKGFPHTYIDRNDSHKMRFYTKMGNLWRRSDKYNNRTEKKFRSFYDGKATKSFRNRMKALYKADTVNKIFLANEKARSLNNWNVALEWYKNQGDEKKVKEVERIIKRIQEEDY